MMSIKSTIPHSVILELDGSLVAFCVRRGCPDLSVLEQGSSTLNKRNKIPRGCRASWQDTTGGREM
jgi:hypothetical protein